MLSATHITEHKKKTITYVHIYDNYFLGGFKHEDEDFAFVEYVKLAL